MDEFAFARDGRSVCTIVVGSKANRQENHSAELLADAVYDIGGVKPDINEATQVATTPSLVLIGSPNNNPLALEALRADSILVTFEDKLKEKRLLIPQDLGSQGFVIHRTNFSGKDSLVLSGHTCQGTFYAVNTLVDRLYKVGSEVVADGFDSESIPIFNVPLFPCRSVATNIGGPDWLGHGQWEKEFGYDYKAFIDWLSCHKINNINLWTFDLEFGIAYPSEKFPECVNKHHPNVTNEFMADLIDYAHERYITVYFFIDFPDNWTSIIRAHPELAGANVDLALLPSSETWWETFQKTGRSSDERRREVRLWVCGSKSETMEFWTEYLRELLDRYPNVDGIGGQFCEHQSKRCNCRSCKEHFFDLQLKYYEEMYRIARSRNPDIRPWFYDAWGAREIRRNMSRFPRVVYLDWGATNVFPSAYLGHYVPRGNWYLHHRGRSRWYEFSLKCATQVLNERRQEGIQLRMVYYKELDHVYQAFEEFSWNPRLTIEEYSRLYVRKRFRRDDERLAKAYAHWIKAKGYSEILSYKRLSKVRRDFYQKQLREGIDNLKRVLSKIEIDKGFAADLQTAFELELPNLLGVNI